MGVELLTLEDTCQRHLLHTKWLLAPSHRIAHQWVERLIRRGHAVVNLHPATLIQLALELTGAELATEGLALAGRPLGSLVVDAAWCRLNPSGYLGRLERSTELSTTVYGSLLALRLAGCGSSQIANMDWESEDKAEDIHLLLSTYEEFLNAHNLVDEAGILQRGVAKLNSNPNALGNDAIVLIPDGTHVAGLEMRFLEALPASTRIAIRHPVEEPGSSVASTTFSFLGNPSQATGVHPPGADDSVQFFRAVGEINEVREVLRRVLAARQPLDEVELLHTDTDTYVPLIFGTAHRYFAEPDRPNGVPVTFAEGIPASLSRPGRAMAGWLRWIGEGHPQRRLVELIADGLLDCGEDEDLSFGYLTRLLRPVAIGHGADRYLPKLDEQIKALDQTLSEANDESEDNAHAAEVLERKLKGFKAIRKLTKRLLRLSREVLASNGTSVLQAAESFLKTTARSISELDHYAAEALIEHIDDRRQWIERLGVTWDLVPWLAGIPAQTRVLGSGPRPGHLHVAHISSGGHSGRKQTFVLGLDDRRFPGAALQDPVLLDHERLRLSPELETSAAGLRNKVDAFAATLSRLRGTLTLSWPCQELVENRETFPSSQVLSVYRLNSGRHDVDLETLNDVTGPPVSFAPTTSDKSLDVTERWLWQLNQDRYQGTPQIDQIEDFFPHLARGRAALRQQQLGFGPFT